MTASDLEQLLEMGFEKERAELAVSKTGGCTFFLLLCRRYLCIRMLIQAVTTVQAALEWLEANQDKSLDEIKSAATDTNEEEGAPALKEGEQPRSLVCNECGKKFRSQAQAEFHASKTEHTDFSESTEEIAPLTEEEKKARLQELREKLAAKRAIQSEQDKADQKRNEVSIGWSLMVLRMLSSLEPIGNSPKAHQGIPRYQRRTSEERTN